MKKLFAVFVLLITYQGFSQTNYVPNVTVSTLAGNIQSVDGQGGFARFNYPYALAVDAYGNIYIADSGNNKIRKITPDGLVSTFAGSGIQGYLDGQSTLARFNSPRGIAIDDSGNVYVADNGVIRKITAIGVSTFAGSGPGTASSIGNPIGLAFDTSGNLYVADEGTNMIKKITPSGLVSTLAGSSTSGSSNGKGTAASFFEPSGVTVDDSGNVYVADSYNYMIRKITPGGLVTTLAGSGFPGSTNGQGTAASFNFPTGVVVDASGNVYVTDSGNNEIRKITPGGLVTVFAGSTTSGHSDGQGSSASFNNPRDIVIDEAGSLYVADTNNDIIRKITSTGLVSTILAGTFWSTDGQGIAASLSGPKGVAIDGSGNVYVADYLNNEIRKITSGGFVSTLAGSTIPGSTDGIGAAASFDGPTGVAVDVSGNVYVADAGNNKIRKITPGGLVSTLVGISSPQAVAVDASGNVYVSDGNIIRKITPSGLVSTFAGSGAYGNSNGQVPAASFFEPQGLAVDTFGNVYVADNYNNDIRKISPGGFVSLLAGSFYSANGNADAQGTYASFSYPVGIAVDDSGNVYVADSGNNEIRKITPGGLVSTLAGSLTSGSVNGKGSSASFNNPSGVAVDASGNVYVADAGNNEIRKITTGSTNTATINHINTSFISVYPNPAKDLLNINLSKSVNGTLSILDIQGSLVLAQPVNGKQVQLSTASLQNGIYVLNVVSDNASYVTRIVIAR